MLQATDGVPLHLESFHSRNQVKMVNVLLSAINYESCR